MSLLAYYDARAPEYDDLYLEGTAPASISDPKAYRDEARAVGSAVAGLVGKDHLDVACGTGFWMQFYAPACSTITLIDQAPGMVEQSRERAAAMEISDRCNLVCADVLDHGFEEEAYDSALVGFLLSHLDDNGERVLLEKLARSLRPNGRLIIVDSIWNQERARVRQKQGMQTRRLGDGREFEIYKRYFTTRELLEIGSTHGFDLAAFHGGKVFLGVTGSYGGP